MRSKCKKLVTDITRKKDLETNLPIYVDTLCGQYNYYATVKMCMNYYTIKEVILELGDDTSDLVKFYETLSALIKTHIIDRNKVEKEALDTVRGIRDKVEFKMKNLTAYADGYEIYEYILNRIEARVKNTAETVDVEQLSAKMFQYVFSENDTVVVNSKLQLLMAQLPVRMTKNKFYDVVSNTLSIYKGGEATSVDEFADMLRTAVLIKKPEGFETEYPELYQVYKELSEANYKEMDEATFDILSDKLASAAAKINEEVSAYMLLQEIVNDVYTILLTVDRGYDDNTSQRGFLSAVEILKACVTRDDMDMVAEDLMPQFIAIEGVQEDVYENIIVLDAVYDDIAAANSDMISELELSDSFKDMALANKLLSTSLFIDLDKEIGNPDAVMADNDYIMKLRDKITEEFAALFEGKDRTVIRSIMCKILAAMPIFLNSQQEIKNYFDYVLEGCKDDSELTACNKLICELIEED